MWGEGLFPGKEHKGQFGRGGVAYMREGRIVSFIPMDAALAKEALKGGRARHAAWKAPSILLILKNLFLAHSKKGGNNGWRGKEIPQHQSRW